jgi:hypothetical protein
MPDLLPLTLVDRVRLLPTMARMVWREIGQKRAADVRAHDCNAPPHVTPPAGSRWSRLVRKGRNLLAFLQRMFAWNTDLMRRCCHHLRMVQAHGGREVVLYGEGTAAELVWRCAPLARVKVAAVCPWGLPQSRLPQSLWKWPETALANWPGPVVIASFVNTERHIDRLIRLGVTRDRMIVL